MIMGQLGPKIDDAVLKESAAAVRGLGSPESN